MTEPVLELESANAAIDFSVTFLSLGNRDDKNKNITDAIMQKHIL